jgi:hypothetical protein
MLSTTNRNERIDEGNINGLTSLFNYLNILRAKLITKYVS